MVIKVRQIDREPGAVRSGGAPAPDLRDAVEARSCGRLSSGKIVVSLRLDPAVVEKFKATGPGWQARINDVLLKAQV